MEILILTALILSYSLYIKYLIVSERADGERQKALAELTPTHYSTSVKKIFFDRG